MPQEHGQLPPKATYSPQLTSPSWHSPPPLPPACNKSPPPPPPACPPQETRPGAICAGAGVLLFINPNLQKKKPTKNPNQTEAFSHPVKVRADRKEKKVIVTKQNPGGKEEAMLCPCYARL